MSTPVTVTATSAARATPVTVVGTVTGYAPSSQPPQPVAGATLIIVLSAALLIAGFAELVSGAMVTSDTGGYYIGGVYVGIFAMITGVRGCILKSGDSSLIGLLGFASISAIVGIIGAALQSAIYSFLLTIDACATSVSTASSSCGQPSDVDYTCSGDSTYYTAALGCAVRYSASYGKGTNQCSCVVVDDSSNTATCYNYNHYDNCSTLVGSAQQQVQVSYAFAVICLLLSVGIIITSSLSLWQPHTLGGARKPPTTSNAMLGETLNPAHETGYA